MLKRSLIYGATGLFMEILWTSLCSLLEGNFTMTAHTSLIMLPIYGGVVFLEPMFYAFNKIKMPTLIRGIYYGFFIFIWEYFTGKMLTSMGICPWHYVGLYNIEGVIRLDYAPLWIFAGLMYERLWGVFAVNSVCVKGGEGCVNQNLIKL